MLPIRTSHKHTGTHSLTLAHVHRTQAIAAPTTHSKQLTINAYGSHSQIPIQARQICHIRWLIICSSRRSSLSQPPPPRTSFPIYLSTYVIVFVIHSVSRYKVRHRTVWHVACVGLCVCVCIPAISTST